MSSTCEYCGQEWRYGHNELCPVNEIARLQAENERLRTDNEDMKRTLNAPIPWLLERDLRAEIEQLQVLVEHWKSLVAGYEQRDHPHGREIVAGG